MVVSMGYISKHITIKEEHDYWISQFSINLSRFVQNKIEEEMKKLGFK